MFTPWCGMSTEVVVRGMSTVYYILLYQLVILCASCNSYRMKALAASLLNHLAVFLFVCFFYYRMYCCHVYPLLLVPTRISVLIGRCSFLSLAYSFDGVGLPCVVLSLKFANVTRLLSSCYTSMYSRCQTESIDRYFPMHDFLFSPQAF